MQRPPCEGAASQRRPARPADATSTQPWRRVGQEACLGDAVDSLNAQAEALAHQGDAVPRSLGVEYHPKPVAPGLRHQLAAIRRPPGARSTLERPSARALACSRASCSSAGSGARPTAWAAGSAAARSISHLPTATMSTTTTPATSRPAVRCLDPGAWRRAHPARSRRSYLRLVSDSRVDQRRINEVLDDEPALQLVDAQDLRNQQVVGAVIA